MTLHTQDWINIIIATGTCAAAFFSWRSSRNANKIALRAENQSDRINKEEKARWLSSILLDKVNKLDNIVSSTEGAGTIQYNLLGMAKSIREIVDMIEMQHLDLTQIVELKKIIWLRIPPSIKDELKERKMLSIIEPEEDSFISSFEDSKSIYAELTSHYDFANNNLVRIVS